MNPTDLREQMTRLVETPPIPLGTSADDLARGQRRLRRRRAAAGLAVATIATGATLWSPLGPSSTPVASEAPATSDPAAPETAATVLERCLELGRPAMPAEHFGDGTKVLTSASAEGRVRAIVMAADGEQWADCSLKPDGTGSVQTYATGAKGSPYVEYSSSGGPSRFSMAERFPANVAKVRLEFASGATFTAPAVDGFVTFEINDPSLGEGKLRSLKQYDEQGTLVGGPGQAGGDASLPDGQSSLIPAKPLDSVQTGSEQ